MEFPFNSFTVIPFQSCGSFSDFAAVILGFSEYKSNRFSLSITSVISSIPQ